MDLEVSRTPLSYGDAHLRLSNVGWLKPAKRAFGLLILRRIAGCSSRGGCDGGAGRSAASAAGSLNLCRNRLGGRRVAFARVVIYIKASALEVQARRSERTLQHTLTHGADKLLLGAEVLDFFKTVAALSTAIGI